MKKNILISALIFVNFVAFAQITKPEFENGNHLKNVESEVCIIDSSYVYYWNSSLNNWELKSVIDYIYDEKYNNLFEYYYILNSNRQLVIKEEFRFDENNNLIFDKYDYWGYDGWWYNRYFNEYKYDNRNRLILKSECNDTYDNYTYCTKKEHLLNTSGRDSIIFNYSSSPSTNGEYEIYGKTEYSYENNSLNFSMEYSTWEDEKWNIVSKTDSIFNENGKVSSTSYWNIYYSEYSTKTEFVYDTNENIISKTNYRLLGDWFNYDKTEYDFDEKGNNILIIDFQWDSNIDVWNYKRKYEFSYNENGNNILQNEFEFNEETQTWDYLQKAIFDFDEKGNLTLEERYGRFNINSDFEGYLKYEKIYDANGFLDYTIDYSLNYSTDEWVLNVKTVNFWSCTLSTQNLPTTESFKIFPNPTTKNINITVPKSEKATNVEIFNLNGQKVYSQNVNSEIINIALPNLNKGLYLVKISNENFVKTEKLVVE